MYTAQIGKIIFERWQKRSGRTDTSVREYFDEVFFPLFFDNERYLMLANNSKFDQAYKQKKKKPLTQEVRSTALADFHAAVEEVEGFEGHLFMGGYSRSLDDATSSMISHQMNIEFDRKEVYYSWLGMAAGIGIKGGVSLLTDDANVLDQIVEGWTWYRTYMNREPSLKPHQIDTWNGWWLYHSNQRETIKNDPLANFPPADAYTFKNGVGALNTIDWFKCAFVLSQLLPATDRLPVYVYSFGQTNTSIGFIPILLKDLRYLNSIYERLAETEDVAEEKTSLDRLYNTEYGFYTACRMGAIGLRTVEPKDLKKYMPEAGDKRRKPKPGKQTLFGDFITYQIWITAMIKNEDLLYNADRLAEELTKVGSGSRGKSGLSNAVQSVVDAGSLRQFVTAVTDLMNHKDFKRENVNYEVFNDLVEQIVKMPLANVPLLLTLLRFKFAFKNSK